MWSFFKHHNWPTFNCFDTSQTEPKSCIISVLDLPQRMTLCSVLWPAWCQLSSHSDSPGPAEQKHTSLAWCSAPAQCKHLITPRQCLQLSQEQQLSLELRTALWEGFCKLLIGIICSMTAAMAIPPSPDLVVYPAMLQRSLGRDTIAPNVFGQAYNVCKLIRMGYSGLYFPLQMLSCI